MSCVDVELAGGQVYARKGGEEIHLRAGTDHQLRRQVVEHTHAGATALRAVMQLEMESRAFPLRMGVNYVCSFALFGSITRDLMQQRQGIPSAIHAVRTFKGQQLFPAAQHLHLSVGSIDGAQRNGCDLLCARFEQHP